MKDAKIAVMGTQPPRDNALDIHQARTDHAQQGHNHDGDTDGVLVFQNWVLAAHVVAGLQYNFLDARDALSVSHLCWVHNSLLRRAHHALLDGCHLRGGQANNVIAIGDVIPVIWGQVVERGIRWATPSSSA
jgi:hypothetical protein